MGDLVVKPYRVAQCLRIIDGISTAYLETGDSELATAWIMALACIYERTMAEASEEDVRLHKESCKGLLAAVDRLEMKLAQADATQPAAEA